MEVRRWWQGIKRKLSGKHSRRANCLSLIKPAIAESFTPLAPMMVMPVLSVGKRDPGRRLQGFYSAARYAELNSKALLSHCYCARSQFVPTYEYKCGNCLLVFDLRRSMKDDSPVMCPKCGSLAKQVFSSVPVFFKGDGFYSTARKRS